MANFKFWAAYVATLATFFIVMIIIPARPSTPLWAAILPFVIYVILRYCARAYYRARRRRPVKMIRTWR